MRPTWAEISLAVLRRNFRITQDYVGPNVTVCAVVKADAYGHGAVECARALESEGAMWFGVTSTEEGVNLRAGGVRGRILLMTGFWRGEEDTVLRHKLTPAVWQRDDLTLLERAAKKMRIARVPVHAKLDTGMARLGVPPAEFADFLGALRSRRHLVLEAVFSHLASAEVVDADDVKRQHTRFRAAIAQTLRARLRPRFLHLANSAAIAASGDLHYNFVRPGISLYGYYLPFVSDSGKPAALGLQVRPVLRWKTRIVGLRQVRPRQPVGYGGAFVTKTAARIAVLPLGYADGLNRHLSSLGRVIVRGQYAPIVGNISMDLTLIDVTKIGGAAVGDEVTLIGEQPAQPGKTKTERGAEPGMCRIDAWEHATHAHTIPYEVLCAISKRVPRRYVS